MRLTQKYPIDKVKFPSANVNYMMMIFENMLTLSIKRNTQYQKGWSDGYKRATKELLYCFENSLVLKK